MLFENLIHSADVQFLDKYIIFPYIPVNKHHVNFTDSINFLQETGYQPNLEKE
jgi:hypothetical protein